MRLSGCVLSLRPSRCSCLRLSLSSTSSFWTLTSTFSFSMWIPSEQDPLCTSPNEVSGSLAINTPLALSLAGLSRSFFCAWTKWEFACGFGSRRDEIGADVSCWPVDKFLHELRSDTRQSLQDVPWQLCSVLIGCSEVCSGDCTWTWLEASIDACWLLAWASSWENSGGTLFCRNDQLRSCALRGDWCVTPNLCEEAMQMEVQYMREMNENTPCKKKQWWSKVLLPIGTRWLFTNKGDSESPLTRVRRVTLETKKTTEMDLTDTFMKFAATPPVEVFRFLLSRFVTDEKKRSASDFAKFPELTCTRQSAGKCVHLVLPYSTLPCTERRSQLSVLICRANGQRSRLVATSECSTCVCTNIPSMTSAFFWHGNDFVETKAAGEDKLRHWDRQQGQRLTKYKPESSGHADWRTWCSSFTDAYVGAIRDACIAYLAQGWPELACAAKDISRSIKTSNEASWAASKQAVRFCMEDWEPAPLSYLYARTNNDHAGCTQARHSTSAASFMAGLHLLRFHVNDPGWTKKLEPWK